jgi:hypothetical protein
VLNNFIRVITFISVFILIFAAFAYDSSVQAKMKAITEEDLAQIEGEAGLTIGLNLTASAVATNVSLGDGAGESINLPSLVVGGSGAGGTFAVATNLTVDIGANSGRTWIYMGNIVLPSGTGGVNVTSSNVNIVESSGNRTLGNLALTGVYLGRTVTGITQPSLANVTAAWMRMGPHASGGGLELYASLGAYVDQIQYTQNTAGRALTIRGLYIYNPTYGTYWASGTDPLTWDDGMTGNGLIGGSYRTYYVNGTLRPTTSNVSTVASMDIGASGSTTLFKLSQPMAITLKVRSFQIDPTTSYGPIMLDNAIFYRSDFLLRNL